MRGRSCEESTSESYASEGQHAFQATQQGGRKGPESRCESGTGKGRGEKAGDRQARCGAAREATSEGGRKTIQKDGFQTGGKSQTIQRQAARWCSSQAYRCPANHQHAQSQTGSQECRVDEAHGP